LRAKFVEPNWVSENDVRGFLKLAGFRPVRKHRLMLFPKWLPGISAAVNGFLARLPGLRRLCLMQVMVARPIVEAKREDDVTVSVIVPCRNEVGNVRHAVERIPAMGKATEILFCDDKSTDGTPDEVRRMQELYPEKNIRLIDGPGICKAENVWTGFRAARGDVLMILDADLTMPPEALPKYHAVIETGKAEFVNGTRLIYPMENEAMRPLNLIANRCFAYLFSYLVNTRLTDTLCGTKVLLRKDYEVLARERAYFGDFDPFGDFDLIFGAAKQNLKILETPIHYKARTFGETQISRFRDGWLLLKMVWFAYRKLKAI